MLSHKNIRKKDCEKMKEINSKQVLIGKNL